MMDEDAPVQQSTRTDFVSGFLHKIDHYKKLVFKYWWIPVLLVGVSVEIQAHLLKKVPPLFVSVGKMIVNMKVTIPNANNAFVDTAQDFFGTQVALMQSDRVVNAVKAHIRVAHPEVEPAGVDVSVSLVSKTTIFSLQAQGQNPVYTQLYLQGIMDEYINLKKEQVVNASTTSQSSVLHELEQRGEEVAKSRKILDDFRASNSVVFLQPSDGNNAADYFALKKRELENLKSELHKQQSLTLDENLQRIQEENAAKTGADFPTNLIRMRDLPDFHQPVQTNSRTANDSATSRTPTYLGGFEEAYLAEKRQLTKLEVDLAEATAQYARNPLSTDKSNAVEYVNTEISYTKVMLDTYKKQSEEQMKNRLHSLEVSVQDMEDQVKIAESNAINVSKRLADYKTLEQNHQRLQANYDQLQASLQQLEMSKNLSQESVTIYEPACVSFPIPPSKTKHLIMAGLIGLVLGIGIMVFLDRLDDRPTTFAEVEALFDIPVLGQFPLLKPKDKQEGVTVIQLDDDRYPLVESFRSLRSAILYRDSRKEYPKKIVITSARPGEGKSMVSANFAITLAQAGARVLLVDADLRRGGLNKDFLVAPSPGLSEVLAGHNTLSEAVVQTHIPNLQLLPCGAYPRHPGVLFAMLGKFMQQIEGHYDFYVFDTPPIMVGDDVLSLAPQMDGLIMVIRAGFTPGRMAKAAMEMLRVRQVKVIGIAFNGVSPRSSDYHYYKFKDYYPQHPAA